MQNKQEYRVLKRVPFYAYRPWIPSDDGRLELYYLKVKPLKNYQKFLRETKERFRLVTE
ncbi:hypothetical protein [Algibacter agarivorans]|uniref:hypothetical protein n=1 Tax=Algibacter agarivorans TaxID=1109741 RepID=UPI0031E8F9A3